MGLFDSIFPRKDFSNEIELSVTNALSGKSFYDVTQAYFTNDMLDDTASRLMFYNKMWNAYNGYTDDGDTLVANWIKPVVNKGIDWLFNKSWHIEVPSGNEIVSDVLEAVWSGNNKDVLCWKMGQTGSITGDVFIQVTVVSEDAKGASLEENKRKVVLRLVPSSFVFPVFSPEDAEKMLVCLMQYPITVYEKNTLDNSTVAREILYTQVVTDTTIDVYHDAVLIESYENVFNEINIVHIQNLPNAFSPYGLSDVEDLISPVVEANNVFEDVKEIVDYHAAPTTLVFGARVSQLEKGANKVWSNLPETARVENLKLEGDLEAANGVLEFLKAAVHELSGVPEKSLGLIQEISNTSGVALEVQYMPLLEKTRRKSLSYGVGINKINKLIIKAIEKYKPSIDLSKETRQYDKLYDTTVVFNSPLPKDTKEQLELAATKLSIKVDSYRNVFKQLNPKDTEVRLTEVLADEAHDLLTKYETAKANDGVLPNVLVVTTGSLGIDSPAQKYIEDAVAASEETSTEDVE